MGRPHSNIARGNLGSRGLEDIQIVRGDRYTDVEDVEVKKVVGTFGIRGGGQEHVVAWVVSNRRKHKPTEPPVPVSDWMKYQLETMFAKWKEEPSCEDTQAVI